MRKYHKTMTYYGNSEYLIELSFRIEKEYQGEPPHGGMVSYIDDSEIISIYNVDKDLDIPVERISSGCYDAIIDSAVDNLDDGDRDDSDEDAAYDAYCDRKLEESLENRNK